MYPNNFYMNSNRSQNEPDKLATEQYSFKDIIIASFVLIFIIAFIYMYFFNGKGKINISNSDINSNSNINSNDINNDNDLKSNVVWKVREAEEDLPKTVTNGEYYDYSKINIKPTITILPAKIYDTITEIKGSVQSTTLASDEYNKNYVVFSGSDKATVITPDMIPKFNTQVIPKQTIDFVWTDVNSGKCYIPEKDGRVFNKIILGDCSGNNANYRWEDGLIKHIGLSSPATADTPEIGIYVQTKNNTDDPKEDESLTLSRVYDVKNEMMFDRRKFDFIQTGDNLSNTKIIHRYSEMCVLPKIESNGKVVLSVNKC